MILSSRKPAFWFLLVILGIGGAVFSYYFFPRAFPIVNVEIKVTRGDVLDKAQFMAQKFNWGPENYNNAASFESDAQTQLYVELEAGGSKAFSQMITGTLYCPYTWRVRHFKENETNETSIKFKPDGTPYGFSETIAETEPGAHLTSDQAKKIAQDQASLNWDIHFNEYKLIESSQEVRPNARVDHTFVYERPEKIGEGRYRLRLEVTGDKFTGLNHHVKIPEAFSLRYEEMRSRNKLISAVARIFIILYLLGGCCFGLFVLMRQRWVIWGKPLAIAVTFGILNLFQAINNLPLVWMHYNTALPETSFLLQYFLQYVSSFAQTVLLIGLSATAAESLTRKAFGHQIQFWKLWTPSVAPTIQVVGRTVGGYLFALFDLALIIGIYIFGRTYLGWWIPSDTLVDPNIMATYFPWLGPVVGAFQAGFWEECLFRAVPIACAALLGQYFNKRNLFIGFAVIAQALIFGAAHAEYAQQPSYARILEMFIPCIIWAGIYLTFGLMPVIIIHIIYDLILMSLVLFVSSAHGAWINQLMVVILGALPLLVIFYYWLKGHRKLVQAPHSSYNSAWHPETSPEKLRFYSSHAFAQRFSQTVAKLLTLIACIALIAWIFIAAWHHDEPSLRNLNKEQAIELANAPFKQKGIDFSAPWKELTSVTSGIGIDSRFVWQTSGKDAYHEIIKLGYIKPPQWVVRRAKFGGPLEDRAEEYNTFIGQSGPYRFEHSIPEHRKGENLSQAQARTIAHEILGKEFNLSNKEVVEISAVPEKLPARTSWTLTYSNLKLAPTLHEGQARIRINIDGDEVVDIKPYIHVPEEWNRQDQKKQTLLMTLVQFFRVIFAMLWIVAVLLILFTRQFDISNLMKWFIFFLSLNLIPVFLNWPTFMASLRTTESIASQYFRILMGVIIYSAAYSSGAALFISFIKKQAHKITFSWEKIGGAVCVGIIMQSLVSIVSYCGNSIEPTWADYSAANSYVPWLSNCLTFTSNVLYAAIPMIVFTLILNYVAREWNAVLTCACIIVFGFLISPITLTISLWLAASLAIGLILTWAYFYLLSDQPQLSLFIVAALTTLHYLPSLFYDAYQGALFGYLLGIILAWGMALYLYLFFEKK